MDLITSAQRDELFETFVKDAFHLALRDTYGNPLEDESFLQWRRGEPEDLEWFQPWLKMMRGVMQAGKSVRRVRVVSEPISEYIRYEWEGTEENLNAGEDIRWLPRHRVPAGVKFPLDGSDWWLFDDQLLAVGHFDEEGRVLGSHLTEEPTLIAECIKVRNQLWNIAIPHREYHPN